MVGINKPTNTDSTSMSSHSRPTLSVTLTLNEILQQKLEKHERKLEEYKQIDKQLSKQTSGIDLDKKRRKNTKLITLESGRIKCVKRKLLTTENTGLDSRGHSENIKAHISPMDPVVSKHQSEGLVKINCVRQMSSNSDNDSKGAQEKDDFIPPFERALLEQFEEFDEIMGFPQTSLNIHKNVNNVAKTSQSPKTDPTCSSSNTPPVPLTLNEILQEKLQKHERRLEEYKQIGEQLSKQITGIDLDMKRKKNAKLIRLESGRARCIQKKLLTTGIEMNIGSFNSCGLVETNSCSTTSLTRENQYNCPQKLKEVIQPLNSNYSRKFVDNGILDSTSSFHINISKTHKTPNIDAQSSFSENLSQSEISILQVKLAKHEVELERCKQIRKQLATEITSPDLEKRRRRNAIIIRRVTLRVSRIKEMLATGTDTGKNSGVMKSQQSQELVKTSNSCGITKKGDITNFGQVKPSTSSFGLGKSRPLPRLVKSNYGTRYCPRDQKNNVQRFKTSFIQPFDHFREGTMNANGRGLVNTNFVGTQSDLPQNQRYVVPHLNRMSIGQSAEFLENRTMDIRQRNDNVFSQPPSIDYKSVPSNLIGDLALAQVVKQEWELERYDDQLSVQIAELERKRRENAAVASTIGGIKRKLLTQGINKGMEGVNHFENGNIRNLSAWPVERPPQSEGFVKTSTSSSELIKTNRGLLALKPSRPTNSRELAETNTNSRALLVKANSTSSGNTITGSCEIFKSSGSSGLPALKNHTNSHGLNKTNSSGFGLINTSCGRPASSTTSDILSNRTPNHGDTVPVLKKMFGEHCVDFEPNFGTLDTTQALRYIQGNLPNNSEPNTASSTSSSNLSERGILLEKLQLCEVMLDRYEQIGDTLSKQKGGPELEFKRRKNDEQIQQVAARIRSIMNQL